MACAKGAIAELGALLRMPAPLSELEKLKAENAALEACLKKLPADLREFVTLAYTPGTSTKELAERAGVKPGSFYMRLNRIRKTLLDCVENSIAQGGLT